MQARLTALALGAALLTASATPAGTPLGGDDGGFVPPDGNSKRCEERVLGQALGKGKLFSCLTKCHVKAASVALKSGTFDDTACELGCIAKYDAVGYPGACPACLDGTGRHAIALQIEAYIDAAMGDVYCAGTTAFGDDDGGFIAPDKSTDKCEGKAAQNVIKFVAGCVRLCHFKAVRHALRNEPSDDEACEGDCLAKYDTVRDKFLAKGICPPCLDATAQHGLATDAEAFVDGLNGAIYCASPGGAFLD